MAHNLNLKKDGKVSFAAVVDNSGTRPLPWHGLGQFVDKAMTSEECIKLAGLNYLIEKQDLVATYKHGKDTMKMIDPRFCMLTRGDTGEYIGSVGKNFELIQNHEAFEFFDSIVGADKVAMFETAGALGKGEKIFITAKLPTQIKLGKDDLIDLYLFLYMGHDGSAPITCAFTPVRIVCNNTLNMALKDCKNKTSIKHRKNAKDKLDILKDIIGFQKNTAVLTEVFERFTKVKMTDGKLKEYIACVMDNKGKDLLDQSKWETIYSKQTVNLTDDIFKYAKEHPSQILDTTKGTLYGAYNSITGYFQNMKEWNNESAKVDKLIMSDNSTEKLKTQKAFDIALRLSK